jgi:hypothetical protein
MRPLRTLLIFSLLTLAAVPAFADCIITGQITATEADEGAPGAWCYTLVVDWDTGTVHALSHLDLIVDLPGGTCLCSDFAQNIIFAEPGGSSDGYPDGCTVEYDAYLECNGDPSIPGIEGILFKWEPIEDMGCEPGPTGQGTFVFYSDLDPVPVDEELPLVVQKASGDYCEGSIGGVFPSLPCDPVTGDDASWSRVKGLYR